MRYRVTHRSAAARPGLTQVLDLLRASPAQFNDQGLVRADLIVSSVRQARLRKDQAAAGG